MCLKFFIASSSVSSFDKHQLDIPSWGNYHINKISEEMQEDRRKEGGWKRGRARKWVMGKARKKKERKKEELLGEDEIIKGSQHASRHVTEKDEDEDYYVNVCVLMLECRNASCDSKRSEKQGRWKKMRAERNIKHESVWNAVREDARNWRNSIRQKSHFQWLNQSKAIYNKTNTHTHKFYISVMHLHVFGCVFVIIIILKWQFLIDSHKA